MFKDHPNFKNIKFVVYPQLRESLDRCCDVPRPVKDLIKEFGEKFPNFDHHLLYSVRGNPDLWFLANTDER